MQRRTNLNKNTERPITSSANWDLIRVKSEGKSEHRHDLKQENSLVKMFCTQYARHEHKGSPSLLYIRVGPVYVLRECIGTDIY